MKFIFQIILGLIFLIPLQGLAHSTLDSFIPCKFDRESQLYKLTLDELSIPISPETLNSPLFQGCKGHISDEDLQSSWNDFKALKHEALHQCPVKNLKQFMSQAEIDDLKTRFREKMMSRNERLEEVAKFFSPPAVEILISNQKFDYRSSQFREGMPKLWIGPPSWRLAGNLLRSDHFSTRAKGYLCGSPLMNGHPKTSKKLRREHFDKNTREKIDGLTRSLFDKNGEQTFENGFAFETLDLTLHNACSGGVFYSPKYHYSIFDGEISVSYFDFDRLEEVKSKNQLMCDRLSSCETSEANEMATLYGCGVEVPSNSHKAKKFMPKRWGDVR